MECDGIEAYTRNDVKGQPLHSQANNVQESIVWGVGLRENLI